MKPSRTVPVAALAVLALAALAVASNLARQGPGPGEAQVQVHGAASVRRAAGSTQVITDAVFLHRGDQLILQRGTADFQLTDHVRYQARRSPGQVAPAVLMGEVPVLRAGELLVTSTPRTSHPPAVSVSGTVVSLSFGDWTAWDPGRSVDRTSMSGEDDSADGATGAMRLSHTLAVGVRVYLGHAHVESAGATGEVAALRSLDVAALGAIPRSARPLTVRTTDPWDRLFLGPAITLDRQLAILVAALDRTSGPHWTPAQLHARVPGLPSADRLRSLVTPVRSEADTMVGATISGLGQRASFEARWRQVFGFHDAGASWGLVALDQRVDPAAVLQVASATLDATPIPFPDQRAGGAAATPVGVAVVPGSPGSGLGAGGNDATSSVSGTVNSAGVGGGAAPTGTDPTAGSGTSTTAGSGTGTEPNAALPGGDGPGNGQIPGTGDTHAAGQNGGPGAAGQNGGPGAAGQNGGPGAAGQNGGPGAAGQNGGPGAGGTGPTLPPLTGGVPPVTLPQVTVPPVGLPPAVLPSVALPSVGVPSVGVPAVALPSVGVPSVTLPPVNLTGLRLTLPQLSVSVTLPVLSLSVTVPSISVALPGVPPPSAMLPVRLLPVTVPPVTVPPVTVPPVTVPPVTLPPVTVPPVTLPPVSVAPVTVPPVSVAPVTVPPVSVAPVTVPPLRLVAPSATLPMVPSAPVTQITGMVGGTLKKVGGRLGG